MPRAKKPIPLEIGSYIGELVAEVNWLSGMPLPIAGQPQQSELRIRFRRPQKLQLHQRCYYYLWEPYVRLPMYLDLVVIAVESETTYRYEVVEHVQLEKWPPGPSYASTTST